MKLKPFFFEGMGEFFIARKEKPGNPSMKSRSVML